MFIYHIVLLVLLIFFAVAVAFAWGAISKLRNTPATYNARLLPFAYCSSISWVLWALQYILLIVSPFISAQTDFFVSTGLSLAVLQNAFWASAVVFLALPKLSPMWAMLPLLLAFLIAFRTPVITSLPFAQIYAVSGAVIFFAVAVSIRQWRQSKILAVAFFLHALTQWTWRSVWFIPLDQTNFVLLPTFAVWHIFLLFLWTVLISGFVARAQPPYEEAMQEIKQVEWPDPLATVEVMISSTVEDLVYEREAASRAILSLRLTELRADAIGSLSRSPQEVCAYIAKRCKIFILIIGTRYGYVLEPEKISAVEFEYRIARLQNPQKILVYVQDGVERKDDRLKEFLRDVQDFKLGYLRTLFTTPEDLYKKIQGDVARWLASQLKP